MQPVFLKVTFTSNAVDTGRGFSATVSSGK